MRFEIASKREECRHCGFCEVVCRSHERCIGCAACVDACPYEARVLEKIAEQELASGIPEGFEAIESR